MDTKDSSETLKSLRERADQGDAVAQFNLGLMYAKGDGVPQNHAEAVKWYRMAADQGDASAQFNLGLMYARGEGVPQNYTYGHAWSNLAGAQGKESSVKLRDKLRSLMGAEQLAEAQKLANDLFTRINSIQSD